MSDTIIWFKDRYGATDRKFKVLDPSFIPRVGEFVETDTASGFVSYVHHSYRSDGSGIKSVVNIYLVPQKEDIG